MITILYQSLLPFFFSALVVIFITIIAEKFGTKVGGILGTLPSTIIIAFIFIAYTKGVVFASEAIAVVPAELGINLVFLFIFVILANRSLSFAMGASFVVWAILSTIIYFANITNIYVSLAIYGVVLACTFLFLEYYKKIPSVDKVHIHYTPMKILFRGVLAGFIIAISVMLSNFGATLSGIFSVFPAILSSTMLISYHEHGPEFAVGMAKSMTFGVSSVCTYAVLIHFLYPIYGILVGTIIAFASSFALTMVLFKFRNKIL